MRIKLHVNDSEYNLDITPWTSLNEALRETIGLTGVKRGCDSGGCGMCTVLLDDKPVFSCMTPAWKAEESKVLTVEGLENNGKLNRLQEEFVKNSAPQCGYCTPAMLLVSKALLDSNPNPSEDDIKRALAGVLCRCTGYIPYLEAVMQAAREKSSATHAD